MSKTCAECGTSMGGFLGAPISGVDPNRCQDCHWRELQQATLDPEVVAERDRVAELRRCVCSSAGDLRAREKGKIDLVAIRGVHVQDVGLQARP